MAKNPNRWATSNWTPGKVSLFNALGLGSWNVHLPKLHATLAEQAAANTSSLKPAGGNLGAAAGAGGKAIAAQSANLPGIYQSLRSAGASPAQAVGILANAMAESNLDPEAVGDNGTSYGLWQFHEPGYPNASSLVTGNAKADIGRQVTFLVQVGGLRAASGTTPEQIAGNFAANFEDCTTCQPGQSSYNERVGYVSGILNSLGMNTTGAKGKVTPALCHGGIVLSQGLPVTRPVALARQRISAGGCRVSAGRSALVSKARLWHCYPISGML